MNRVFLGAASAVIAFALAGNVAFAREATTPPQQGRPEIGSFGFDAQGMDRSVRPGDDFYGFANGGWEKATPIPADRAGWGGFAILRDRSDNRTRAIIEEVSKQRNEPGSPRQKVGDFFASFMDEAAIEAKGAAPLRPLLAEIAAIGNREQLSIALAKANRMGVSTPVGMAVELDLKDNSIYAGYVGQGGLGLPDRDYYLEDKPKFVEVRQKYVTHIANMLTLAGIGDAAAKAGRIYDLEKKIAATHWTQTESRQFDKLYNPFEAAELGRKMPGLAWPLFLDGAGIGSLKTVIITQPSAIEGAARLVASEPLETWKDYLAFHTIKDAAPYLSKAFVEENFAFDGPVLTGTPQLKDRWKRGVDLINGALGEAVGQIYVEKYFPPEAKAKADELVRNLTRAMDARLQALDWMAPETQEKARRKLAAFTPKIGYPDKWRDYSALVVAPGDVFGNVMRATAFEYDRQLAKIGKPVDRSEWQMTPQTVNAYANPQMNEIVFPAAILQAPFFDPHADPAINYGGIGMVIGHEISHHFDDQGRKFDPEGRLADWWTPEDVKRFEALTAKLVAQYEQYEPLPGSKVNGALTLGENMADLAGLTIAYDAYKLSLGGKPAPVIDGFTGEQRFFLGFAQVWRNKYRDATLQQLLTVDPHTPGHIRPRVARNLDVWYAAFGVKPGDSLFLPKEQRVRVW